MKTIKLYNTLTQTTEDFVSIHKNQVNMYVCGATVYDHIHIGNARPVIFFDLVKRVMKEVGYTVKYVSNITDIDDKIIERAKQQSMSELELTNFYTDALIDISKALGSELPDVMPKATEYVDQMKSYIQTLIDKGFAYETSLGVYFRVQQIKDYGILSKQQLDQLSSSVRVDLDPEKESPQDFSIWKKTTEGLNFYSPWGDGRPGWHTECAVMNHALFDGMIDIHGGGSDLKFPHHENERAHAMAHDHHGLAKYWMHVGRLDLDSEKMSKSLGNAISVKDLMKHHSLKAFRLLILAHHYRQPIKYSELLMEQYEKNFEKIEKLLKQTALVLKANDITTQTINENIQEEMLTMLTSDFDTPNVVTRLFELQKELAKEKDLKQVATLYDTLMWSLKLLGLELTFDIQENDIKTYQSWLVAREEKNYERADLLRTQLISRGYFA
jgi:cysteinyl-tRNA synthetase